MKLVDILSRELKVWPETTRLAQDSNGHVFGWTGFPNWDGDQWLIDVGASLDKCRPGEMDLADDHMTASVTRAEWQAAVDALNAPKVVEWDGLGNPPAGLACEYRKTDAKYRQGFVAVTVLCYGKEKCFLQHEASKNEFTEDLSSVEFRSIPTAEQVAAEEREKAIKDLYYTINWDDDPKYWDDGVSAARKADYAKAIDAGYAKVAK